MNAVVLSAVLRFMAKYGTALKSATNFVEGFAGPRKSDFPHNHPCAQWGRLPSDHPTPGDHRNVHTSAFRALSSR
jgi:hypothetical protein